MTTKTTPARTYVTIGENIRLYNDGCCRVYLGEGATPGNGTDVAPGERVVIRSRIDTAALSDADRATLAAWDAEQDAYPNN